ncbi:TPA: V3/V1b-type arginine vasotocin receptor [Vibrio parahaemolyticus]|nr:V3/V1b-type arginine vasotocin receptor [Vibrio parahaemolyticus]HCH0720500.1 V3/V1b-type arginine vasotocin receptor [Vibrio parahaemolyticus]
MGVSRTNEQGELMEHVLNWITSLNPFYQSILGAAVFAFSSWLLQQVIKKGKSGGSKFWDAYTTLDIHKHVLHKHYVRSENVQLSSYGSSIALLVSARWSLLSFMILIFVFAIQAAIDGKWLYVAGSWFAFNAMLEARSWVKDSSTAQAVSHIDQDKIDRVTHTLNPNLIKRSGSEDNNAQHLENG